jgi:hypothetical protein
MKIWKYYTTNVVPYPSKDEFTDVFVYSKGKVVFSGPYSAYKNQSSLFVGMLIEKTVNEAGLKEQRRLYGEEASRLEQEFKTDLFEMHGVTYNPKANLCYGIAYDHAHHAGFEEVAGYFSNIVELIK